ncbi:No apical meristem (NAM) protein [Corchorus capsularis]|uniref:No apical meristem (NAM) protein n=1 Tax=Corchorus capsularis TaxID=210143 RepID=A0A1R3JUL5_COCAP|nr:No apical meristem (NAM) protein [Corchorus capsularis]
MVPTGFRFNPTDEELLEILHQKVVTGNVEAVHNFIVERNIYELEPQDLQWSESVALNSNERYCFCKRESDSREVAGRGWWKATSHVKTISSANNAGLILGYKRPLTFHRFKVNQKNRKDAFKTDWIMHEYGLRSITTEWRLCKIKYKGKERFQEENVDIGETAAEEGCGSSIINPMQMQLDNHCAFQEHPILPLNNDIYEIGNCPYWSNSSQFDQYPIPSSLINMQPLLDYNQSAQAPTEQSPFPDLWFGSENWH